MELQLSELAGTAACRFEPSASNAETVRHRFRLAFASGAAAAVVSVTVLALASVACLLPFLWTRLHQTWDRPLFAVAILCAALAFGCVLACVEGAIFGVVAALLKTRRAQAVFGGLVLLALGTAFYVVDAVEIERGINFIHRRLDPSVAYEIAPAERALWQVGLGLVPVAAVGGVLLARLLALVAGSRDGVGRLGVGKGRIAFAVLLIVAAIALQMVNLFAYMNLYRRLHLLLYVVNAASLQLAWFIGFPGLRRWLEGWQSKRMAPLAVAAVVLLHFVLEHHRNVESLVFTTTTVAREQVRLFRAATDFDRDGSSAWFGGEDAAPFDPAVWPGALDSPGNGVDEDGYGGDAVLRPGSTRGTAEPRAEPVTRVVLISLDALRADAFEAMVREGGLPPRVARFVEGSVRFRRAYAVGSYTEISLGALWAGRCGVSGFAMPRGERYLPEFLRDDGVHTAAVTTSFFSRTTFRGFGFARFVASADDSRLPWTAPIVTEQALTELAAAPERSLLWVHYFDTHSPHEAPGVSGTMRERYHAEIRGVLAEVERLFERLEAPGSPPTAVVLTGDHGEEFGEHGSEFHGTTLYEEAVHVPLLIRVPGVAARSIASPVRLIDVGLTVLDLFAVVPPGSCDGRSLVPFLREGHDPGYDPGIVIPGGQGIAAAFDPEGRWKLILDLRRDWYELFDLHEDPREQRSLADLEPQKVADLRARLADWRSNRRRQR